MLPSVASWELIDERAALRRRLLGAPNLSGDPASSPPRGEAKQKPAPTSPQGATGGASTAAPEDTSNLWVPNRQVQYLFNADHHRAMFDWTECITPDEALCVIQQNLLRVKRGKFIYDQVFLKLSYRQDDTDESTHSNGLLINFRKREAHLFEPHRFGACGGWNAGFPAQALYLLNALGIYRLRRVWGNQATHPTCALHVVLFGLRCMRGEQPVEEQRSQDICIPCVHPRIPMLLCQQAPATSATVSSPKTKYYKGKAKSPDAQPSTSTGKGSRGAHKR